MNCRLFSGSLFGVFNSSTNDSEISQASFISFHLNEEKLDGDNELKQKNRPTKAEPKNTRLWRQQYNHKGTKTVKVWVILPSNEGKLP
jgi:hypothetical protein